MEHAARACMLDHAVSGTSRHMKARAGQALGGAKREGEQAERLSTCIHHMGWLQRESASSADVLVAMASQAVACGVPL